MGTTAGTSNNIHTPEAVGAINRAYAEACQALPSSGAHEELRFKLAEHILYLARNGETDEHRLCRLSVTAILGNAVGSGDQRGT